MNNISRILIIKNTNNLCLKNFHKTPVIGNNILRQVKILKKLIGTKKTGTKKRWIPHNDNTSNLDVIIPHKIGETKNVGKNATRRVTVLNKLFMKYITDLMATGIASEEIVGKGIEVSRVKVASDFQAINVFWVSKGGYEDNAIEDILKKSSGIIRHELSQLKLMGEVPRVNFVKDTSYAKLIEVDSILKNCSTSDYVNDVICKQTKDDLNLGSCDFADVEEIKENDEILPLMRHDVLGLNHKEIMSKILTKMKKSKQAWDQYEQIAVPIPFEGNNTLENIQKKIEISKSKDEEFKKFLTQRNHKKNAKQRKNEDLNYLVQSSDLLNPAIDENTTDYHEDEDFIEEEDRK